MALALADYLERNWLDQPINIHLTIARIPARSIADGRY